MVVYATDRFTCDGSKRLQMMYLSLSFFLSSDELDELMNS